MVEVHTATGVSYDIYKVVVDQNQRFNRQTDHRMDLRSSRYVEASETSEASTFLLEISPCS